MPHITVKLYPGKSEQQKQALAEAISEQVQQHLGSSEAAVSVSFVEVGADKWKDEVYTPEIEGAPESLYIKPGYKF